VEDEESKKVCRAGEGSSTDWDSMDWDAIDLDAVERERQDEAV
jgi:hypothetical protein